MLSAFDMPWQLIIFYKKQVSRMNIEPAPFGYRGILEKNILLVLKKYPPFTLNLNQTKLGPKWDFPRQNDYTIRLQVKFWRKKTIFGPSLSAILENLMEPFFRNVPKTAVLAKKGHFLVHQAIFGQNENFSQKNGSAIFLPLLSPQLHAKFQENPWSSFRDQIVTNGQTGGQG